MKSLVRFIVRLQRDQTLLVAAILLAVVGFGAVTAWNSEIVAFPELTNVQVQVITQFPGKAAEEVERKVTMRLEVATNGLPGLINQRSISLFGLSVITLTFDDAVNAKTARIDVAQRLNDVPDLPDGVKPGLSPDSTPLGEIFRYTIEGDRPVDELRLIEDWKLEREFKSIPGVADIVTFGGPTRTIETNLDVDRMKAFGLTVSGVAQSLQQNHANAGGASITHGDESYVVRSLGLIESVDLIGATVIGEGKGVPVRIRDIGKVAIGSRARLGQVGINKNSDAVEGLILLRNGSDTLSTCAQIREKIEKLNNGGLPPGVKIRQLYDRTQLIERSSETVFHNIAFGILLVCVVLTFSFGLSAWRLSLAVACVIPFSLLIVFIGLKFAGYPPNLISLGAVDFGIIIETAIFAAEAVLVVAQNKSADLRTPGSKIDAIEKTLSEVLKPALLCAGLLLVGFIPILALQRVEGRIFKPLGITLVSALIGGQIGALLFLPLAAERTPFPIAASKFEHWVHHILPSFIERIEKFAMKAWRPRAIFGAIVVAVLSMALTAGREFLPAFNEGSLFVRAYAPLSSSREASVELAQQIRERLMEVPEVINVISQVGRPDDGTDVNGFDVIETIITLKPPTEWTSAKTLEGLTAFAQAKLGAVEGVDFSFSQPIKDNVDEAISGVKGDLVVKIFGPKLEEIQKIAVSVADVLRKTPGAKDVTPETLVGQPEYRFIMDKEAIGRAGIRVTDVEEALETALAGRTAGRMIDDQSREIDIVVRPQLGKEPGELPSLNQLSQVPILTPEGVRLKLTDVSNPQLVEGITRIFHEQGERRTAVKLGVDGRPVVDFVNDASAEIQKHVTLPPGYRLEWAGSFANASRAGKQLMIIVPLCLLGIIIMLHAWFRSWSNVAWVLCEIPFSLLGGFLFLKMFGLNLSVSAAVGAIVLVGVSFLTAMMLISGIEAERSKSKDQPVQNGLKAKAFGVLLSSSVAIIGLVPASLSRGIGSETAKPFAVMIMGGLVTSLLLTLTLLPALMLTFSKSRKAS